MPYNLNLSQHEMCQVWWIRVRARRCALILWSTRSRSTRR